jgi:hypothetical protein
VELVKRMGAVAAPAAEEVARRVWVVVPESVLDARGTDELRDALIGALDRGALNLVVDLTAVTEISQGALEVLGTVSETLRARGGLLWLATMGAEGFPFSIRPVDESGLGGHAGLTSALEGALARQGTVATQGGDPE